MQTEVNFLKKIEAWEALPDSLFMACLESMPRRVQAVIEADGWHTKY